MWVARDKDDGLTLFIDNKPGRGLDGFWYTVTEHVHLNPKASIGTDIIWDKEPVEVELVKKEVINKIKEYFSDDYVKRYQKIEMYDELEGHEIGQMLDVLIEIVEKLGQSQQQT